jgi:serine/threonine protein kinase
MMMRKRPYLGKNRQEIKEKMSKTQAEIKINEIPKNWSKEIVDFINKLLKKNPENRLGIKGISEIKFHPWLRYYDWKLTYLKREKAPFIPPKRIISSEENAVEKRKDSNSKKYMKIKQSDLYQTAFVNYQYFNRYSLKCREKVQKFVNPHDFYDEIEKKEQAFKMIASKIDDEAKKVKEENKKRVASVSPLQAVKTKIFSTKNVRPSRKISCQVGEYCFQEKNKVNLNPIKVNVKKDISQEK